MVSYKFTHKDIVLQVTDGLPVYLYLDNCFEKKKTIVVGDTRLNI